MTTEHSLLMQFECERDRLRGVAFRMLGSASEAEDAVQEAWLRLQAQDDRPIDNLPGWLTTVVSRIALDMLRSRRSRREDMFDPAEADRQSDPRAIDPERDALLAESVGIALLVVLDRLRPAERLAFVLHDMFGLSFNDIAPIIEQSPASARQLASRARRRVQGAGDTSHVRATEQHRIVSAFFAASRKGDFAALLDLLDPDAELAVDASLLPPNVPSVIRGAEAVAKRARLGAAQALAARVMLIDGNPGIVVAPAGRLSRVIIFDMGGRRIQRIEIVADPARLDQLELGFIDDTEPTQLPRDR